MNLFRKYTILEEKTLQEIKRNFSFHYKIDLDKIFDKYVSASQDDTAQGKPSPMKLAFSGIGLSENHLINTEFIKYDERYYNDLLQYEKIINKLRKPHAYDAFKEEFYHTFGLSMNELLANCNSEDESEQINYLRNYYGINLPSTDDFSKTNKELLSLEADFQKKYGLDINKCYVKCFRSFQEQKQIKLNKATNDSEYINYCNGTLFEKCWDIVTSKRIVPRHISRRNLDKAHLLPKQIKFIKTYNKHLIKINFEYKINKRYVPCFSGHRRDWQNNIATISGETDLSKLLQVTMDEHHTSVTKKGIANYVRDQLENLSTNWNDVIKIAVLLDLYWNLKALTDKSTSIKLITFHNDNSDNDDKEDNITPCFDQKEFRVIDTRKYKIAKEIEQTTEMQQQGKLLCPFTPSVKYSSINRTFEVSNSFAEIQLNFLLNPDITDFFTLNFNMISKGAPYKHKTFRDALSIYTKQFSFTKISDYYCLESLMGFNLSMKLYDYLWPMANVFMNPTSDIEKEKKICFDKYVVAIISSLFKIKSPYLRLRVADIIIQSYGHSKYIKKERYLLSMQAIQSFLDTYVKMINEGYQIIYDSMFYYYGKNILSIEERSPFLNELEDLINYKYKAFIQIDPDSILADFAPYDNCKDDFGYIFNELLINQRGKPRYLYGKIMQNILMNNYQLHLKADK
jgi:hypothetical protein